MNIVVIDYDNCCVNTYTNLPITFSKNPKENAISKYIDNELGYNGKNIAYIADEYPIRVTPYFWTKDGIKKA